MSIWVEAATFLREFRKTFHTTGAILPSGRFLARALAHGLHRQHAPCRILEVGPGSGAVTEVIARYMRPGDHLDAVEINPRFVSLLQHRVARDRPFRKVCDRIRIIASPVQQVAGEGLYDYIISGLPMVNFSVSLVEEIFAAFHRLIKAGGILSYFEYIGLRLLKRPFVGKQERQRLAEISLVLEDKIRRHQVRVDRVLVNVPPAYARHLRLKPSHAAAATG
jgi:phospholipid N-methyltransferase